MNKLITEINLNAHDDIYQMIVDLHDSLSEIESSKANAKLVLLLANHIGDKDVFAHAVAIVREQAS